MFKKKKAEGRKKKKERPCEYSKKGQHATWNIYYLGGMSLGLQTNLIINFSPALWSFQLAFIGHLNECFSRFCCIIHIWRLRCWSSLMANQSPVTSSHHAVKHKGTVLFVAFIPNIFLHYSCSLLLYTSRWLNNAEEKASLWIGYWLKLANFHV